MGTDEKTGSSGGDTLENFCAMHDGEDFSSPREALDGRKRKKISVHSSLEGEKGAYLEVEGGKPFRISKSIQDASLSCLSADKTIPLSRQKEEGKKNLSFETCLKKALSKRKEETLNARLIPFLADLLVLSGQARYEKAEGTGGRAVQGIAGAESKPKSIPDTRTKAALVAYATNYGSTEEIARAIGDVFKEKGWNVNVSEVREVTDVAKYDLVVIGSPLYFGDILSEAVDFAMLNKKGLEGKRVAAFVAGATLREGDPGSIEDADSALDQIRGCTPLVDAGFFGGKVSSEKMSLINRLLMRVMRIPFDDYRDWDAIRSWAEGLLEK